MSRVVLGVAGGIAAYKAASLLRELVEAGHDVTVVPDRVRPAVRRRRPPGPRCRTVRSRPTCGPAPRTSRTSGSAARPTWSSSPRRPPTCSPRPRTAWPTTCSPTPCSPRAVRCCSRRRCTPRCGSTRPRVANVATLRSRGAVVLEPGVGRLTGADTGKGRLPEPDEIARACELLLARPDALPYDLAGRHVVVSAGGTREALDPVRFLGNASSGKQGYAVAAVAAARGARVTLVAANVALPDPAAVDVVARRERGRAARRRPQGRRGRRRRRDGRGGRGLPPGRVAGHKIKKSDAAPAPIDSRDQSGRPRRAGRRAATGPGAGRFRRRDGRRHRLGPRPRPREAGPQGLRPARRQRGRQGRRLRPGRQRRRDPRRGRHRDRCARSARKRCSRPPSATRSQHGFS